LSKSLSKRQETRKSVEQGNLKVSTTIDLAKAALLVIDMQNDFCDKRGLSASTGRPLDPIRKIIPNTLKLVQAFRKSTRPVIYLAQIYEPDGVDSPFSRHKIQPGLALTRGNVVIAARGSWGAAIIDELKPKPDEYIVEKRRFSGFYNTDLDTILRCREIETIVVTGCVTYVCVEHTVRDAFVRDFDVIVAGDAVAGWNDELHRNSLKSMSWSSAAIVTTKKILKMIENLQICRNRKV